jgi:DNA-directed RNA polymerase specialized sigma subunit
MSFEVFAHTIEPKLKQIALKYRHIGAYTDEDDLFNEMLVFLWDCWQRDILADKTESYIVQACYFHLRNYLRTMQENNRLVSLDEGGGDAENGGENGDSVPRLRDMLPDAGPDLPKIAEGNALYEKIMSNGLRKIEKEIIRLLCDGCTVREVGDHLHMSHAMVIKYRKNISEKVSRNYGSLLV